MNELVRNGAFRMGPAVNALAGRVKDVLARFNFLAKIYSYVLWLFGFRFEERL